MPAERPDISLVTSWRGFIAGDPGDVAEAETLLCRAKAYLEGFSWCGGAREVYVGAHYPGIFGIFLFEITPVNDHVDNWIWVIIGDLPPAYLTIDLCPTPSAALDGYLGAMHDWVNAIYEDRSTIDLIPVNVEPTVANANILRQRLEFLDNRILPEMIAKDGVGAN